MVVIIDNETIKKKILVNGELVAKYPWLHNARAAVTSVSGCAACQRNAKTKAAEVALEDVKKHIAQLSHEDKEALKRILNADSVRVYWTENDGRQRIDF
jgi:hypothetical protein